MGKSIKWSNLQGIFIALMSSAAEWNRFPSTKEDSEKVRTALYVWKKLQVKLMPCEAADPIWVKLHVLLVDLV